MKTDILQCQNVVSYFEDFCGFTHLKGILFVVRSLGHTVNYNEMNFSTWLDKNMEEMFTGMASLCEKKSLQKIFAILHSNLPKQLNNSTTWCYGDTTCGRGGSVICLLGRHQYTLNGPDMEVMINGMLLGKHCTISIITFSVN